jgi:phospholipid/cholesterol/gamma-HCH transport system ATP-binding protein
MIAFRAVTAAGFCEASFSIEPGRAVKLLTLSDADTDLLLRLILGAQRPEGGEVFLFGELIGRTAEARVLELLRRIGFVWRSGGFVSNLKVWENILLPLQYHGNPRPAEQEEEVADLLARLGLEADRLPRFLQSLPGNLGTRDRRFISLVRAMLQEPELMVYVDVCEGLDGETAGRVLDLARWYHGRREGRASLFISDSEPSLSGIPADAVLRQGKNGRIEA